MFDVRCSMFDVLLYLRQASSPVSRPSALRRERLEHSSKSGSFLNELPSHASEQLLHKISGVNSASEIGVLKNGLLKGYGGLDTGDHVFT